MLRLDRQYLVVILTFLVGIGLYIFAVLSTFHQDYYTDGWSLFTPILITCIGGLGALIAGYTSEIFLGGALSLNLAELIAHVNRSRHIIEITKEETDSEVHF